MMNSTFGFAGGAANPRLEAARIEQAMNHRKRGMTLDRVELRNGEGVIRMTFGAADLFAHRSTAF